MAHILTGLRTNADYHLGNYLGAILPMIELQRNLHESDSFYLFLPDLHSLESDNMYTNRENSIHNARLFLAAGFDTLRPRSYIYRQSRISAHTQLQWILNWYVYMGEASRMTQFKDKSRKQKNVPVSLLTYPILQAADILLYDTEYVPVGDDQRQHLELTRDIAIRFNKKHGSVFTIPKSWEEQNDFFGKHKGISRIRSLTDPTKKMSKSDENPNSRIDMSDTRETVSKKIMSSTTDSIGIIHWDWENQPGITNLLAIYEAVTKKDHTTVLADWEGKSQYGELKKTVAEALSLFLEELQEKRNAISLEETENILLQNESIVREQANKKLTAVELSLGLL